MKTVSIKINAQLTDQQLQELKDGIGARDNGAVEQLIRASIIANSGLTELSQDIFVDVDISDYWIN